MLTDQVSEVQQRIARYAEKLAVVATAKFSIIYTNKGRGIKGE